MNIAFVGNFSSIKGSRVYAELVKHYGQGHRWHIFGIVADKESFFEIKEQIALAYPYEEGELPKLLKQNKIDLVLLLSTWPETFSKTFFEVASLGIPVVSFKLGYPSFQFPQYSGWVNFGEGSQGIINKLDRTPIEKLKEEIAAIYGGFSSQLQSSSRQKFELLDEILG